MFNNRTGISQCDLILYNLGGGRMKNFSNIGEIIMVMSAAYDQLERSFTPDGCVSLKEISAEYANLDSESRSSHMIALEFEKDKNEIYDDSEAFNRTISKIISESIQTQATCMTCGVNMKDNGCTEYVTSININW